MKINFISASPKRALAGLVTATVILAGGAACNDNTDLIGVDTNRVYNQIERLGNPLVSEVFFPKRDHGLHNNKSPIDDIKKFTKPVDIGLIEGGCCNSENVEVLRSFRKNCKVLVSVGECAVMGGLPALVSVVHRSRRTRQEELRIGEGQGSPGFWFGLLAWVSP